MPSSSENLPLDGIEQLFIATFTEFLQHFPIEQLLSLLFFTPTPTGTPQLWQAIETIGHSSTRLGLTALLFIFPLYLAVWVILDEQLLSKPRMIAMAITGGISFFWVSHMKFLFITIDTASGYFHHGSVLANQLVTTQSPTLLQTLLVIEASLTVGTLGLLRVVVLVCIASLAPLLSLLWLGGVGPFKPLQSKINQTFRTGRLIALAALPMQAIVHVGTELYYLLELSGLPATLFAGLVFITAPLAGMKFMQGAEMLLDEIDTWFKTVSPFPQHAPTKERV